MIYLEQTLYINLERIFEQVSSKPWQDPHQRLETENTSKPRTPSKSSIIVSRKGKKLSNPSYHETFEAFYERRFKYEVSNKDGKVRIAYGSAADRTGRYGESTMPTWFRRATNSDIPILPAKRRLTKFANKILSLVHVQPTAHTGKDTP